MSTFNKSWYGEPLVKQSQVAESLPVQREYHYLELHKSGELYKAKNYNPLEGGLDLPAHSVELLQNYNLENFKTKDVFRRLQGKSPFIVLYSVILQKEIIRSFERRTVDHDYYGNMIEPITHPDELRNYYIRKAFPLQEKLKQYEIQMDNNSLLYQPDREIHGKFNDKVEEIHSYLYTFLYDKKLYLMRNQSNFDYHFEKYNEPNK